MRHSGLAWKPGHEITDFFRRRVDNERETVRVFGVPGKPIGLCIVSRANLDQLFVAPSERGKGVGERLLADAEARMRESGVKEAYLYVAQGNDGVVRFYERHDWTDAGKVDKVLEVAGGTITWCARCSRAFEEVGDPDRRDLCSSSSSNVVYLRYTHSERPLRPGLLCT
jgi:ribosomal protein S18 acetylase RimI-like enzyme